MTKKSCKASEVVTTEMVMPNDTNPLGNLMGGNLLRWMDIAAAISAYRHSESNAVTAAVDNVSFTHPIKLGDIVTITSKVTRAFNTSMEVHLEVFAQSARTGNELKSNEAFYTFVALDADGNKKQIPQIIPETEEGQRLYDGAQRRRELRLVLAGRIKPSDATAIKELFDEK